MSFSFRGTNELEVPESIPRFYTYYDRVDLISLMKFVFELQT